MASSSLSKVFWGLKNPKLTKSEFSQKTYHYSDKLKEIEDDLTCGAFDLNASRYIRIVTLWVLDSTRYCCSSGCTEKHGSLLQNELFCKPVIQEGARCKEESGGRRRLPQSTPIRNLYFARTLVQSLFEQHKLEKPKLMGVSLLYAFFCLACCDYAQARFNFQQAECAPGELIAQEHLRQASTAILDCVKQQLEAEQEDGVREDARELNKTAAPRMFARASQEPLRASDLATASIAQVVALTRDGMYEKVFKSVHCASPLAEKILLPLGYCQEEGGEFVLKGHHVNAESMNTLYECMKSKFPAPGSKIVHKESREYPLLKMLKMEITRERESKESWLLQAV